MQLTSPAFVHEALIPAGYTCDGDNFNPPLAIVSRRKEALDSMVEVSTPAA